MPLNNQNYLVEKPLLVIYETNFWAFADPTKITFYEIFFIQWLLEKYGINLKRSHKFRIGLQNILNAYKIVSLKNAST